MSILVIAEHEAGVLKPSTLSTIAAAQCIDGHVIALLAGSECQSIAEQLAKVTGVSEVFCANHTVYAHALPERVVPLIHSISKDFTHILFPSTTFGKNIAPRLAAMLDVGQVSDVIEVIDNKTYKRPIYAGNAIETLKSLDAIQVLTVRTTAFDPVAMTETVAPIRQLDYVSDDAQSIYVSEEKHSIDRPALNAADIVISGGRGLQNKETFERLAAIADHLSAAVGASRAAVDAGYAPNDWQVGQTGQIVAPKLYIALGISGAIQHLAGMKDSGVIVAINNDPEAPIFQIADYGLVADVHDVLTQWEQVLQQ